MSESRLETIHSPEADDSHRPRERCRGARGYPVLPQKVDLAVSSFTVRASSACERLLAYTMLREAASAFRCKKASRDPIALFRQLSQQYASSPAPIVQTNKTKEPSPAVDALRQRLAAGESSQAFYHQACAAQQLAEQFKHLMQVRTSLNSPRARQMRPTLSQHPHGRSDPFAEL